MGGIILFKVVSAKFEYVKTLDGAMYQPVRLKDIYDEVNNAHDEIMASMYDSFYYGQHCDKEFCYLDLKNISNEELTNPKIISILYALKRVKKFPKKVLIDMASPFYGLVLKAAGQDIEVYTALN